MIIMSQWFSVLVLVPPGEPVIVTEKGKPLRGLAGPFNEGDPLTLTCKADIGKPRVFFPLYPVVRCITEVCHNTR